MEEWADRIGELYDNENVDAMREAIYRAGGIDPVASEKLKKYQKQS